MIQILHRINTIEALQNVDFQYWVEVDLRAYGNQIILNHEAFESWDNFEEYLKFYRHKFIILNIKESGIEDKVISLMYKYGIENYFLLDVEFPYIYSSTRNGNRKIAMRFSEDEPIEQSLLYRDKVWYIFIDTNTRLPLDKNVIKKLEWFKTCLVSPDRWGRPEDIMKYKKEIADLWFQLDMVMVWQKYKHLWKER